MFVNCKQIDTNNNKNYSNWASDIEDRRQISRFIVTLGSLPISWKSKKQQTVALSSCKAECMALAEATKR